MNDKDKFDWLIDILQWVRDDNDLYFYHLGNWSVTKRLPNINSNPDLWLKVLPKKIVDLSPLIGTNVICEFWCEEKYPGKENTRKGFLVKMDNQFHCDKPGRFFDHCRPLFDFANMNGPIIEGITSCGYRYIDTGEIISTNYTGLNPGYTWP